MNGRRVKYGELAHCLEGCASGGHSVCGVVGQIQWSNFDNQAHPLQEILNAQRARGPDHQNLWITEDPAHLALGHNRLSILDLDPRSNQPFFDSTHSIGLTYNGEIYNYLELKKDLEGQGVSFRTTSDTEVIVEAYKAWGLKAFAKFNGMFALALWDQRDQKLRLVRDRFGVKPLYYHSTKSRFTFASNPLALARAVKAPINFSHLNFGVTFDLFEGTQATAFQDVHAVTPGHILTVQAGLQTPLKSEAFYRLTERLPHLQDDLLMLSDKDLINKLEELLLDSLSLRLRSDVPITLSLSGGLDSGIIAGLLKAIDKRPSVAFTFGHPSLTGSESHLAQKTAAHVGIPLIRVSPHNLGDGTLSLFEETLIAQASPFAHPSVMAQHLVFRQMQSALFKVSLGGQGADEAFAGYRKFLLSAFFEKLHGAQRMELLTTLFKDGAELSYVLTRELFSPQRYSYYFKRLLRTKKETFFTNALDEESASLSPGRDLCQRQIQDILQSGLPTLLRYEDSNSMHHSIESRMPFLDYRVIEFGVALPTHMKVRHGFGKWILRQIAAQHIPKSIAWDRNKRAFSLDQSWWLNEGGLGKHLYTTVQAHWKMLAPHLSPQAQTQMRHEKTYLNPNGFSRATSLYWLTTVQDLLNKTPS